MCRCSGVMMGGEQSHEEKRTEQEEPEAAACSETSGPAASEGKAEALLRCLSCRDVCLLSMTTALQTLDRGPQSVC